MSKPIVVKIDVTKIDKARLYKGAKGTYLDAILRPTPDSKYGEDYMIVQSVSKEEREQGIKGNIIGNARILQGQGRPAAKPQPAPQQDDDANQVPF